MNGSPPSRSKRLWGMVLLMAGAAGFATYRIVEWRRENPEEVAAQEIVVDSSPPFFWADTDRLNRLGRTPRPSEAPEVGDWPQWRGRDRTGTSREQISSHPWPADGPPRLWTAAGGAGHSGLAVVSGRVFTLVQAQDEEAAICLDAATGKTLWSTRWKARFEEASAGLGPHTTPTVADGRVYTLGSTGKFHCLEAESGAILWRRDLLQDFKMRRPHYGVSGNPLVEGDLVIVQPGAKGKGAIAAFDRWDGRLVWRIGDDPGGYSSPMAATIAGLRQIVFVTGESLMASDARDGRILWRVPWKTQWDLNVATPIIAKDDVFVSSGYGKGCALLEVTRDSRGGFDVRPVYEHNRMRNHFSTCVLLGEHLYGFDDLFLVCMELRTGNVMWKERGFGKGSLIAADGKLIVLGEKGKLALVEAQPSEYRELTSSTISASRCWALPSLAGGRLFVRDQETVQCFDLRPSR